ncbi:tRNA pseudouridine(55) synthase TruB [Saccharicrinis sp. FJH62]|uniref:tRNA pseudouridine(55) synthase TruB n=1 Tax=Saccharicrinis sp. FJH62 TaxID=3344657 RepID=UPI0035D51C81
MNYIEGEVIILDKPLGWTSFDLVKKIRIRLQNKLGVKKLKVGHAGTLDPLATGVMLVCTGKATKQIEFYQAGVKEYIATIKLGETTPSFDLETKIDRTYPFEHITKELVEQALEKFKGEIQQIPPEYSAVKINGKRAYKYARKGEEVEMRPKILVIDEIEILKFELPVLTIRIVCSKGTYIRALARDIGRELNSGGHLIGLQRTRVGDYTIADALSLEEFEKNTENLEHI